MAQFLLAKFLSQALEWKDRFPAARFYAGLRFVPFIYEKARFIFSNYSRSYPDNTEFTQKFVKALRDGDKELLKIINPEAVTWEHTAANKQFEEEATLEQQMQQQNQQGAAQAAGQPPARSFSLIAPPPPETPPQTEPTPPQAEPTANQSSFQVPQVPGLPPSFANTFKNFWSNTRIFAKKNLGRAGRGLANIAKGIGRGIAGGISSGLGAAAPSLGRIGHGLVNGLQRISAPGGIGGSGGIGKLSKSSNRFALVFIGVLLFMVLVGGVTGGLPGTTPTGEASPGAPGSSSNGLNYTLPLKDPAAQPLDIKDQVKADFPGAKLEYWDKVIQTSKAAGLNPALILSIWIEETGASQTTLIKNGGSEIPVNGQLSKGHLGCAPWEDQTIDESLTCIIKFGAAYTNDQFSQFMAAYSGGPAADPFSNNPNFPKNIKEWYSKLVPAGTYGALTEISVPTSDLAVCPVAGNISTPYGYNIYGYVADAANEGCQGYNLCHNGIDIAASEGTQVKSVTDGVVQEAKFDPSRGNYIIIKNPSDLYITYEHLQDPSPLQPGTSVKKNDIVGKVGATGGAEGVHLHYKIKQGTALLNPLKYLQLSNPDPILLTKSDNLVDNNYNGSPPQDPSHNKDNWGTCQ